MIFYIIGIIFFVFIIGVCCIMLYFYSKDEKKLVEVTNEQLVKMGKVYTKEDFENKMFEQYANIISSVAYENYTFLKDAVSDELYNQILLTAKKREERHEENIISDIKKEFSKLISFDIVKELEVAKLWVRYSCIEYVKGPRKSVDEDGQEIIINTVVDGNADQAVTYEYILTFVKNKSETENIVCPNCGFKYNILTSSTCMGCESEVVPKKLHWVYVDKISTNISKNQ